MNIPFNHQRQLPDDRHVPFRVHRIGATPALPFIPLTGVHHSMTLCKSSTHAESELLPQPNQLVLHLNPPPPHRLHRKPILSTCSCSELQYSCSFETSPRRRRTSCCYARGTGRRRSGDLAPLEDAPRSPRGLHLQCFKRSSCITERNGSLYSGFRSPFLYAAIGDAVMSTARAHRGKPTYLSPSAPLLPFFYFSSW